MLLFGRELTQLFAHWESDLIALFLMALITLGIILMTGHYLERWRKWALGWLICL